MLFQNRFVQAAKFIASCIQRNKNLEILNCIKVTQMPDKMILEATDLTTFVKITLPIWTEVTGSYFIDTKVFLKLQNKVATGISEDSIRFGNVVVPAKHDETDFPQLDTKHFHVPSLELPSTIKTEFCNMGLRASHYVAPVFSGRTVLTGICIRDGLLYATDGHSLIRQKTSIQTPDKFEAIIPPFVFNHLSHEFIIDPTFDVSFFFHEDKTECTVPDDESAPVTERIGYIKVEGRGFELVTRLLTDPYPTVDNILPKEHSFEYSIDRVKLSAIIKNVILYTSETKNNMFLLLPSEKKGELIVRSVAGPDGVVYEDYVPAKTRSKKKWNGVALNAKFLSTILDDCTGDNIIFKANSSALAAVTFEPGIDSTLYFLLMPLRREIETQDDDDKSNESESDSKPNLDKSSNEDVNKDKENESPITNKAAA